MLTNEEIGILSRILDKADTVYRSSIVYEENGAFNTLAFIDRLYFTSSVEALSIALNKDFMKEDGDEVNRFYSRNYDRILKETEETMGNVSTAFDRVRKNGLKEGKESAREENREYERGQYRKGYEEGRKDAVEQYKTMMEFVKSGTSYMYFTDGYEKGLAKSHFHAKCSICGEYMHFQENDNDWERVSDILLNELSGYIDQRCSYSGENSVYTHYDTTLEPDQYTDSVYKLSFFIGQEHEHLHFYCQRYDQEIHFDQNDDDWPDIRERISNAFSGWCHTSCKENQSFET